MHCIYEIPDKIYIWFKYYITKRMRSTVVIEKIYVKILYTLQKSNKLEF